MGEDHGIDMEASLQSVDDLGLRMTQLNLTMDNIE
jgi:hypothetical protein